MIYTLPKHLCIFYSTVFKRMLAIHKNMIGTVLLVLHVRRVYVRNLYSCGIKQATIALLIMVVFIGEL